MTYVPTIHDWRRALCPVSQVFRAGGQSVQGGMMLGGVTAINPEPGGRGELFLAFPAWRRDRAIAADASWTISRLTNGAVMRFRLYSSVQLVPWTDLDIASTGQTWASGAAWANDALWRAAPYAPVAAAASAGAETCRVDMSIPGRVLQIGHVIGFFADGYDFTHVVMDVEYDTADAATITVSPPLRRGLTAADRMLFRPAMLATCRNAAEVLTQATRRDLLGIGAVQLVEALV